MLLSAILSFAFAVLAILALQRASSAKILLDRPNDRSLHSIPKPKIGGIAVVGAVALAGFATQTSFPIVLQIAVLGLAAVSAADDIHYLPVAIRLGAHALAAIAV